ncbi:unnamed protein product [Linum trigynum]|uniref:Uncharacterized protein n=1 Tax=Linum trigynum TaxID=586398 RepID=A0AAV2FJJ5_9ROSI
MTIIANVPSSSAKKLAGNTAAVMIPPSPTRAPTAGKSHFPPEISTHGPGSNQEHKGQIRSTTSTALNPKSVPLMSPINSWKFRKKKHTGATLVPRPWNDDDAEWMARNSGTWAKLH